MPSFFDQSHKKEIMVSAFAGAVMGAYVAYLLELPPDVPFVIVMALGAGLVAAIDIMQIYIQEKFCDINNTDQQVFNA